MLAPKVAAIAAAAAAALTPALDAPSAAAKAYAPGRACFYSRNIEGFNAPNDTTVYLRVSTRDVYEAKLFAPCIDIDWSQRIAMRSRGSSWVCEGRGAVDLEFITRSPAGRQTCQVTSVRRLSPAEIAAMPKKYRP